MDGHYLLYLIDFDDLLQGGVASGSRRCVPDVMPTKLVWLFSSLLGVTGSIYSDTRLSISPNNWILN